MNYIIIYLEIEHLLNFLTQEEKGDFLDLLIIYGKNQKLPETENKKLLNVFNFMKGRLDTQFEKAKLKAETAKKNGSTGGRPKKEAKNKQNRSKTEANVNEESKSESKLEYKSKRFIKPTLDEIKQYCSERKNNINAEKFINYYEANGWKIGKNAMKDWKACIRTWEGNDKSNNTNKPISAVYNQDTPRDYNDLAGFYD